MRVVSFARFSAIALALFISANVALAEGAHTRALITSPVNEGSRVTLSGNTHPAATAENDRGRVSDSLPMEHLQLLLRRPVEQDRALDKYITDLQTPASPNYHRWLSAREFGDQYGLAKSDVDAISNWLQGHGFQVNVRYSNGVLIDFSGTAGMVRDAFQTEIHYLQVKSETHISNMSDPKIPAALAPGVMGIVSLNDFRPHQNYRKKTDFTTILNGSTFYLVVPGDLATIYNLNPLFSEGISGQGQTIVLIEDSDMRANDWHAFRQTFGLNSFKGGNLIQVNPASSGTNNCKDPKFTGANEEASLDVEYASAAAPSATVELASCADTTTFGGLIAIQNLLNASSAPPAVMSMSYSLCEAESGATLKAAFNSAFQQAVTEGVSVFGSSGDALASECDRPFPASFHGIAISGWTETPYNVSVGGTDFADTFMGENSTYWSATNSPTFESALSYVPETPWDDSCATQLVSTALGFLTPYGSDGACNSTVGFEEFLNTVGAGGGPSECATGTPSVGGVVSGTCQGYAKPSWQNVLGVPNDGVRDTPDVSLFAANGVWAHYYPFCATIGGGSCAGTPDTWPGAGGTSFSSPIMAAMQSLVNQNAGGRQGNPNVVYYALANTEYGTTGSTDCNSTLGNATASTCVFYDVTLGDIVAPCNSLQDRNCYDPSGKIGVLSTSNSSFEPAYAAATGYDMATGIGTVNAFNLVHQWSTAAPKAAWDKR
ncbi:MAG TPA: S53 family peptidase [Candidatus Sulfotelmatobacter sp.]|nr:S53 family peptidase [Candidatus Sulfotelmatobacter sp.]